MGARRKDQGGVAKDKLKAKTEPRSLATDDIHTPTEIATPKESQPNDAMELDVVSQVGASGATGTGRDNALAVQASTDTTIEYNVPGASPKKKSRPINAVVDLENDANAARLPSHMTVSDKLDMIYSSLMARVTTLERRDMQIEQQLSVTGGLDMRLKKIKDQVAALIDGFPSVRQPEPAPAVPAQSAAADDDPWMKSRNNEPVRDKARAASSNKPSA
eukprot:6301604-Amphidinium_carterae.1